MFELIRMPVRHLGLSLAVVSALLVAGCANNTDTTSGSSSVELAREEAYDLTSGAKIHVVYDETGIVGAPVRLKVRLRAPGSVAGATKGTVHWGDNTADRITDDHNVIVKHIYNAPGTYNFAIQIDKDEKIVAGTITILPAPIVPVAEGKPALTPLPSVTVECTTFVVVPQQGRQGATFNIEYGFSVADATLVSADQAVEVIQSVDPSFGFNDEWSDLAPGNYGTRIQFVAQPSEEQPFELGSNYRVTNSITSTSRQTVNYDSCEEATFSITE